MLNSVFKSLVMVGALLQGSALACEAGQRAVGATYLQAAGEDVGALHEYIRENWLAMDAIAVEQGLMHDYQLLLNDDPNADWDLLMLVTYNDEAGYVGIQTAFNQIRGAHEEVLVAGQSLNDLGKIVRSTEYLEQLDCS